MIKDTPSIGRMAAMVGFTLSCVALLLFLWISFGGTIPLRPEGYRFEVGFKEASLLVKEADVRMAGLTVGKVKAKRLDVENGITIAELEIDEQYAPIPRDTKALLRIKALLGETYVELTPGDASGPALGDGDRLPATAVAEAVEIDEIISLFDKETRANFQSWIKELAMAIEKGRGEDFNDAIGNLPRFVASGDDVLTVLDSQEPAVRRLVRNSGRALNAVNERRGQLRELIGNANDFFGALASRNESLAEAVFIFPTFLDESRVTLRRLKTFARDTRPLVQDLEPVARDLEPTLRDVGNLAPDLKALFRNLDPLIDESPKTLPSAARFLRGAEPLFEGLHPYLQELNPILAYLNFNRQQVADFITNGSGSLNATLKPLNASEGPRHYLRAYSAINSRGVGIARTRVSHDRGNSYPAPNYLRRARPLGIAEAFDCKPTGGRKRDPTNGEPPCFVAPKSLWDGGQYPTLGRGEAPVRSNPPGNLGSEPAAPVKAAVVGAGPAGLTALVALTRAGIDTTCFEKGDRPGGLWAYGAPLSGAYRSLHLNTSRERTQLASFPMPSEWPDYPSHEHIGEYFARYVDESGVRDRIRYGAAVEEATRLDSGGWRVRAEDGFEEEFDVLVVASGHNWEPRLPDPPYPGSFDGRQVHAHDYREAEELAGKRVLVVGMGNSSMDIAVESSTVADATFLSTRRGTRIVPKYVFGKPADQVTSPTMARLPWQVRQPLTHVLLRLAVGRPESYGLPAPESGFLRDHPTISDSVLSRLTHGEIAVKPGIERFDGDGVVFSDGSREEIDTIVWCTGYRVTVPYIDPDLLGAPPDQLSLFKRMFHHELDDLFFIGLVQTTGSAFPVVERQSQMLADHLTGSYELPPAAKRRRDAERRRDAAAKRYGEHKRPHLRVEFDGFMRELAVEHRRGRRRAA